MSELRLPLDRNEIRGNKINNAFGMVRNAGTKAHQGWDLLAMPLTNCYAIADGIISLTGVQTDYGNVVALEFEHRGRKLHAFYAHLSVVFVRMDLPVRCGEVIALTGRSGNAHNLSADQLHLHFEIRTVANHPGVGLAGRLDPAQVYGVSPIHGPLFAGRGTKTAGGFGLKVKPIDS